jgi:hypothetical protein
VSQGIEQIESSADQMPKDRADIESIDLPTNEKDLLHQNDSKELSDFTFNFQASKTAIDILNNSTKERILKLARKYTWGYQINNSIASKAG